MVNWITPTDITPATEDSWQDADVSALVPAGATGVILHIKQTNISGDWVGFRKNGSGDNRYNKIGQAGNCWVAIGVDANRILELYAGGSTYFYIVGYFTDDAVFFTNAVDKSLGSINTWVDIDISSDTGGDTAIGAIFEIIQVSSLKKWGLRKDGSSDSRLNGVGVHGGFIVGVSGSEICEGNIDDTGVDFFLSGYIISDSIFNTNATDYSLASTASWIDLPSALPSEATGGYIEVFPSYGGDFGLRKNGSAEDIYSDPAGRRHCMGIVECDVDRKIEGKISTTNLDFWLVGYPYTAGGAGTNMEINIGDAWKDVSKLEINIGDSWKTVTKVQLNVGDTWKTIFEP